jgi:hypothetical protein
MDIEEIYDFIVESQGVKRSALSPKADLCYDLGIEGDDFFELEEKFMEKYSVNMTSYRWYFHHAEEGINFGAMFYPPPYNQVEHIAVTPVILLEAAKSKTWPIKYPEHNIIEGRPDIVCSYYIYTAFLVCFLIFLLSV